MSKIEGPIGVERLVYLKKIKGSSAALEEEEKISSTTPGAKFSPDEKNPYYYEAYGLVYKVQFLERGLRVYVDINHLSPINSK